MSESESEPEIERSSSEESSSSADEEPPKIDLKRKENDAKQTPEIKENIVDEQYDYNWVGPMPSEATASVPTKKRKILPYESLYLENLPNAESYEKSYMHRDIITHLVVTKSDFIVTASIDGHLKFWKKMEEGIEFVKHFRSHLAVIVDLSVNCSGTLLCTTSADKSVKIFDVINFDMINMISLDFIPSCSEFIHSAGDAIPSLAITAKDSNEIYIFDAHGDSTPIKIIDKLHKNPVIAIKYNIAYETVITIDSAGILEYWMNGKMDYKFPSKIVSFDSKLDTSLYEFVKCKTIVIGLTISQNGHRFATISTDRKVRVFTFLTGKLIRVYDETIPRLSEFQQKTQTLPNMEFGRRMATERDLAKSEYYMNGNLLFDDSGNFLIYCNMFGVKILNCETNRFVTMLGKSDNLRPIHIALFQGKARRFKAANTLEHEASDNPTMQAQTIDPILFCTAYKKPRFYLYSRRLPSDLQDVDRDVFNEKPSKEDIIAVPEGQVTQRIYDSAIIHTTSGDIHLKLFGKECPKTVENFCVHSRNGYYNGHIFHRVIKGFMIQTGDPTGTGTGGQSIWGSDFKDEFVPTLKHDRPYTLSMANAGPNSNGSQFFITVLPTPWLDNKHTIFARVHKGMEVVQNICNAKTNPKTDKPYDDIKIISIYLNN